MKLWWVESALSSCLCGLLPLCELLMRAVVPYARHRRTERSFLTRGVDKEMCGSRPWEAPTAPFPLANWRLSTFCGRCFRLLREQLRIHRLFRSPSRRNASRGDVDRKPAARLCYSLPPKEAAQRFSFLLIREMLAWPPREHRSVRRARSWTRRRLWPRAARGDQISCRATDSPTALRTATGSASSCTGAAIWAGVTVSFLLAASVEPKKVSHSSDTRLSGDVCSCATTQKSDITHSLLNCLQYNSWTVRFKLFISTDF